MLKINHESILPSLKQHRGFKGLIVLVDHHTDKVMSITMWETAAELEAGATNDHLQAQLAKVVPFFVSAPVIKRAEVVRWSRAQQP